VSGANAKNAGDSGEQALSVEAGAIIILLEEVDFQHCFAIGLQRSQDHGAPPER